MPVIFIEFEIYKKRYPELPHSYLSFLSVQAVIYEDKKNIYIYRRTREVSSLFLQQKIRLPLSPPDGKVLSSNFLTCTFSQNKGPEGRLER